jgi:histidine kinase
MKAFIKPLKNLPHSLAFKLIFIHSLSLVIVILIWILFNNDYRKEWAFGIIVFLFLLTPTIIFFTISRSVTRPLKSIIKGVQSIAKGDHFFELSIHPNNELGKLVLSINQMAKAISQERTELQQQRDESQILFDQVPCLITVQDKNFRLLNFNQEFASQFEPKPGDYCFKAYKGRNEKCVNCLVEKTFEDGKVRSGEETGLNKDGNMSHWILRTSPIRSESGEIIATMEMSIDITEKRKLEKELEISEQKYQEIFDNIPNPVFVLDYENLEILDCNASVEAVYDYVKEKIVHKSFLDLFLEEERDRYTKTIKSTSVLDRVRHVTHSGENIFVNIRVSLSEYPGRKVLLVTTSDITKRLETEQQLIQASKMATLGEMASAMAHELNQPLSVIKTACGFFIMKTDEKESIEEGILSEVIEKMDRNVDRATRIINNMREFARKSGMDIVKVQVNDVIEKAFEFFTQQMKLREIEMAWELEKDIPKIDADPGRLEQVFINLFLNARDAIEEKWAFRKPIESKKKITVTSKFDEEKVICQVCDTGIGVSESLRDKIFEPFFTTKEVGKGMGLGLSISYGIVKEFGGSISAAPNKPEGACFILEFPIGRKKNKKDGK